MLKKKNYFIMIIFLIICTIFISCPLGNEQTNNGTDPNDIGNETFEINVNWPEYMSFIDSEVLTIAFMKNGDNTNIDPTTTNPITSLNNVKTLSLSYNSLDISNYDLTLTLIDSSDNQIGNTLSYEVSIPENEYIDIDIDSVSAFKEIELSSGPRDDLILTGGNETFFGTSLSIYDDKAVICDNYDVDVDSYGLEKGSAHIFLKNPINNNWEQSDRLVSLQQENKDLFGFSSCISENRVIVGAPDHTIDGKKSGCAFIFTNDIGGWDGGVKIQAAESIEFDKFGYSVAINGDTAIVGTNNDSTAIGANHHGRIYIFNYNETTEAWTQSDIIDYQTSDLIDDEDYIFGQSIALEQDTCIVGGNGFVYILNKDDVSNEWIVSQRIEPSDIDTNTHEFGKSVDISNNNMIVGAPGYNPNHGRAYIYTFDGESWIQSIRLDSDKGNKGASFGKAVAISDDSAVVSDYRLSEDENIQNGGAYIYKKSGSNWEKISMLFSSDKTSLDTLGDCFGWDLSMEGDTLFVSAYLDDFDNLDTGSVYVYEMP